MRRGRAAAERLLLKLMPASVAGRLQREPDEVITDDLPSIIRYPGRAAIMTALLVDLGSCATPAAC